MDLSLRHPDGGRRFASNASNRIPQDVLGSSSQPATTTTPTPAFVPPTVYLPPPGLFGFVLARLSISYSPPLSFYLAPPRSPLFLKASQDLVGRCRLQPAYDDSSCPSSQLRLKHNNVGHNRGSTANPPTARQGRQRLPTRPRPTSKANLARSARTKKKNTSKHLIIGIPGN